VVAAVVLTDFTADGVAYQKNQQITVPKELYNTWAANGWVGPGGDPKKQMTQTWVGPGSDTK
jgi:hypothetical protein